MTYPLALVERARVMSDEGMNQSQIAKTLGVSRAAVRDWVVGPRYVPLGGISSRDRPGCYGCDDSVAICTGDYVYLLGLYLGDGHLSQLHRGVWRLRIFQDQRYPGLIDLCCQVVEAVSGNRPGVVPEQGCVSIAGYWKHWTHLFPQHGPGLKHRRDIQLEPWQGRLVDECPEMFLRGLVHSDGCRSLNTIRRVRHGQVITYAYPRYMFTNASDQIRELFTDACDNLGIRWRRTNARNVAVSRRDDVAFLDTFIGPKS